MKLATVRSGGNATRLWVEVDGGWFDVAATAARTGQRGLDGVTDVGSLYRAGEAAVASVRALRPSDGDYKLEPGSLSGVQLAPVVTHPGSIVCVGRNYIDHIREGQVAVPERPLLFAKFPNTLIGDKEGVVLHSITRQLDYEGELAFVVARRASRVRASEWRAFVAGFTIINDVSGRDLQNGDLQWIRGKSLDTWAPLGPVFVTADEIADPHLLNIRTWVNGDLRQNGPTSDMLFKIPELLEFITEAITLQPGDLVATGTPAGVGLGFDPPRWLAVGDLVEVEIEGIGVLHSPIVKADAVGGPMPQ